MGKIRSHTDQNEVFQHAFNEEYGALEVVLVGSELKVDNMTQNISVDTSKVESKLDVLTGTIKDINYCVSAWGNSFIQPVQKEVQVVYVDKIIVQEKIVEVERIVEVIKEVPGPSKIEVVQVTVDREVIVTKTEYKDLSKLLIAGLALQGLIQILTVLLHK